MRLARPIWLGALVWGFCAVPILCERAEYWRIDTAEEWQQGARESEGLKYDGGLATSTGAVSCYRSVMRSFATRRSAKSITFKQSPDWQNWSRTPSNVGPSNLEDAPVFLSIGPNDYWMFGLYGKLQGNNPDTGKTAKLTGYDEPLVATIDPHQFNAPGAMKRDLGGYHAWHSRDMVNWVHYGNATPGFARWVTSAEYVDGKCHIYYDFPNDQDPHLYIDDDLTDGVPGKNMGMAFHDPSNGSDAGFIRDLQGRFHVFYEDWSPIDASKHSWDSPLAGHAVSPDGIHDFKILAPPVDERTTPTGETGRYRHPHWHKDDPQHFPSPFGVYNVHKPEQNAFGDWAPIAVGGQYYLFSDFHPAHQKIGIAWFTSDDIHRPFRRVGEMSCRHPDPDIGFAEGHFWLVTQNEDFTSPGPWVPKVEARVGVDTDGDKKVDAWTDWQEVKETYGHTPGFAKQVKCTPASMELSGLPAGLGFCFECRMEDGATNKSRPILDSVSMSFDEGD